MGAPKQKWNSEEEAALKAGVLKHGAGKWRSILKDPEFSAILSLRSNVDLKDKWRNMSVMANGLGSREKARLAVNRTLQTPKHDENPWNNGTTTQSDEDYADPTSLATSSESPQRNTSKQSSFRSDTLIMEAINKLKEPGGSNKETIGAYIEEEYWAPPNFKRLLSAKLKYMTARGKLLKTKRKYRIAPTSALSDKGSQLSLPFPERRLKGRQMALPDLQREDFGAMITKSEIDIELAKMRNMTPQEASAAAAQAVAEAEAAITEAEEAGREADAAEADAEVAQAFVDAAAKTFKGKSIPRLMVRA